MVASIPFSMPPQVQIAAVKKVDRKPNPRDEEKYNQNNRQAHRETDWLSQNDPASKNAKKVDLRI